MASIQDALHRYGGMYGKSYRDGFLLSEAIEVTGAVEVNRIEVPLVGQNKQGYKPGRESREGSLRIQKIDARWELDIWEYLEARRLYTADPTKPKPVLRQFDLKLEIADPDAFGVESWQLYGCQIWRLPLGFSITDDIIDRELPMTWENEEPVSAFTLDAKSQQVPAFYTPAQARPEVEQMLVDFEHVLLDLKAALASKKSHGGDALLTEIARLEVRHRCAEGLPEKALRLYGAELQTALSPTATSPSSGLPDGTNERAGLDPASHRSKEMPHEHDSVPAAAC